MSGEQREDARYQVTFDARVSHAEQHRAIHLTNLSRRGCRFLLAEGDIGAGAALDVLVDRVGALGARVKWRRGEWYGIVFDRPLHDAVLDHMRLFLSREPALYSEDQLTITG